MLAAVPADAAGKFTVVDAGHGRVALRTVDGRLLSVGPGGRMTMARSEPAATTTFQWMENVYGDLILLSLETHRYLNIDPATGAITADQVGPAPDRRDGSCFTWNAGEP